MDIFINFLLNNILLPLIVGIISSIIATQITVRHVNPEYLIKRKIKMALKNAIKAHKCGAKNIGFSLCDFLHSGKDWSMYKKTLIELTKSDKDIKFKILPRFFMIDKKLEEFTESQLDDYMLFCNVFIKNLRDQFKMDFVISDYKYDKATIVEPDSIIEQIERFEMEDNFEEK